jgi:hypothetical protein
MRLSLLASLNLLLGRFVGYDFVLHPLFFLIIVTINLGLYALMVYSGTLNKTLIAMMVGGLAGVLAVIAYGGLGASAFAYGGPYSELGYHLQGFINEAIKRFPKANFQAPSNQFWWAYHTEVAYTLVDVMGFGLILASGVLARFLQGRARCRHTPESPPIDSGAASPL